MAALYNYKPILTCAQDALKQLAQESPIGFFDSLDEHAKLLVAWCNVVGVGLAESTNWQQLVVEFSITGDGLRTEWDLPTDMSRFVNDTGWSHSNRRPVIILNPQQQAAIQSWLSQSFYMNPACRLMGDQLAFLTAPAAGEIITFEYITKNWVLDENAVTLKAELANNGDTPRFDSILFTTALKLKWLETRGMATGAVMADFVRRYQQVTMRDNMAQMLTLNGGTFTGYRYLDNYYNAPDTNLGS